MNKILIQLSAVLAAVLFLFSCQSEPGAAAEKSEAQNFVENLGVGYNLGNTLDAYGAGDRGFDVLKFETSWGAPVTTEVIFEDLAARGIKTIRLPVAWSIMMQDNYTIHPNLMNRVVEITEMALKYDMYVIINIHWDGGWIKEIPVNYDEGMKQYISFWTQIAEQFKDYDDHVIFESMNEEGEFEAMWNRWTGVGDKNSAYGLLNYLNQTFVDLIRNSGGNNATRYLLIAGYATDVDLTVDPLFVMPTDAVEHLIVSVHYYTPSTFAIISEDVSWGKSEYSWGTASQVALVGRDLAKLKTRFIDQGIPVILGEYGCPVDNKDPDSIVLYLSTVAREAWDLGICPVLWAGAGGLYDRVNLEFSDPRLAELYLDLSQTPRP